MESYSNSQKVNICLIGGSGRSGTTILKQIFAKHSEVAIVPEWRFSVDPDGVIDFFNTLSTGWSPYLFDVKLKRLERLLKDIGTQSHIFNMLRYILGYTGLDHKLNYKLVPRYTGLQTTDYCPNYLELVNQLIEQLTEFRYRGTWTGTAFLQESSICYHAPLEVHELACILGDFIRQVAWFTVKNQKARHYVEDNTWNILWFDKLLQLVPEAKLVHIYRDPRDVVASYTQQSWGPSDPIQAARMYKGIIEHWWVVRQHLLTDSFLEISLESLVADPESVLRYICEFWEIEWDEALLTTDLRRSNSGRWKKDLTRPEQEQVGIILEKQLTELGYQYE